MFFDLDMIEIFMLISLAITFILFFCVMHHFKHRILSLETKTDTMYKIINELVKLQKMHIQDTRPQPEPIPVIKPATVMSTVEDDVEEEDDVDMNEAIDDSSDSESEVEDEQSSAETDNLEESDGSEDEDDDGESEDEDDEADVNNYAPPSDIHMVIFDETLGQDLTQILPIEIDKEAEDSETEDSDHSNVSTPYIDTEYTINVNKLDNVIQIDLQDQGVETQEQVIERFNLDNIVDAFIESPHQTSSDSYSNHNSPKHQDAVDVVPDFVDLTVEEVVTDKEVVPVAKDEVVTKEEVVTVEKEEKEDIEEKDLVKMSLSQLRVYSKKVFPTLDVSKMKKSEIIHLLK